MVQYTYKGISYDPEVAIEIHRQKLIEKAEDQIFIESYKKILYNKLQNGKADAWLQENYDQSEALRKGADVKNLWITINPKHDDNVVAILRKRMEKLSSKPFVKELRWTYEQRGECSDTKGTGVHLHMLLGLKDFSRLDNVKRSIHTTFDDICGNKLCVDIRKVSDVRVNDKIEYLQGNKWDADKDDKILTDIEWRKDEGLESFYYFDESTLVGQNN